MKFAELLENYIPERRTLIIKVRRIEILIHFDADLDHNGNEVYSMTAYEVDWNGKPTQRYWNDTYNRTFDTRKQFDAAYARYAKRNISEI